jgi:hypothetical protein
MSPQLAILKIHNAHMPLQVGMACIPSVSLWWHRNVSGVLRLVKNGDGQ